jgi:hypothetical protein
MLLEFELLGFQRLKIQMHGFFVCLFLANIYREKNCDTCSPIGNGEFPGGFILGIHHFVNHSQQTFYHKCDLFILLLSLYQ